MKKTHLLVTGLVLSLFGLLAGSPPAAAKPWWMRGTPSNVDDFLPPDAAFRVSSSVEGSVIHVRWNIADGYYLYRQKIEVRAESPDLVVSEPELPPGQPKTDQYLGKQEIYTRQLEAKVAYTRTDAGAHPVQIKVTYQGCAEAGLCYLPMTKVLFPSAGAPAAASPAPPQARRIEILWQRIAIFGGFLAFLIAGFVLQKNRAFTPPP
jgi:thiol:disulfide interchange protein DsbD